MRRLGQTEKKGLSKLHLLIWGLAFVLIGIISRSILQNGILQMDALTGEALLDKLSGSNNMMIIATVALVLQALETCAIPILAFLLVNAFHKGKEGKKLFLCVLAMAAISEIPYNLAMYGKWIYTTTRNPAVTLVVGLVVLYFFRRLSENSFANVLIKTFVGLAAVLWTVMLNVEHGIPMLVLIMVLWALREKKTMRVLGGGAVAAICMMFSPMYLLSAVGIFPVHYFREEEEDVALEMGYYAIYPAMLAVFGIVSLFL